VSSDWRDGTLEALRAGARFAVAGLLAVAGYEKLAHYNWWLDQVVLMQLVPRPLEAPLAAALPGVELTTGLLLAAGLLTRSALLAATALFFTFAGTMTSILVRKIDVRCGCFGPGSDYQVSWMHVGLNVVGAGVCLILYALPPDALRMERLLHRRRVSRAAVETS
jgi:uncharacterized membrane protein YphA (DoxX/SURF4 family)